MARRGAGPVLAVVATWALVYLPPLLSGRFLPARDLAATHLPWRTVWAAQVRGGHLPVWDPLSTQGRPLLANPNAMAAYPGTLLFLLAAPETAEVLHIAVHHLLLLAGLYALARRSGASAAAAAVAAGAVGTCGVVWSATTFLNVLAAVAWAAWALAAVAPPPAEAATARRRALAAGVAVGMAFLAGEPVLAALAGSVCAVLVLVVWPTGLRRWAGVALPAAVAVAAPVLVPLLAVYGDTARGALGAPPGALAADALAPRRWVELLLPTALGPPLADASSGFWAAPSFPWQRYYPTIFLPAGALLLLPLARGGGRGLRVWWGIAAASTAFAALLGHPAVAAVAAGLPGLGHVRFAIKLLVPAILAMAPLLAAGWQRLAALPPGPRRRLALVLLLPALAVALAAGPGQRGWRALLSAAYPAAAENLVGVGRAELAAALLGDAASLALPPAAVLLGGPQPAVLAATVGAAGWLGGRGVLRFDDRERWAAPPPPLSRLGDPPPVLCALPARLQPQDGGVPRELQRFWAARAALVPGYGTRWGAGYVLTRGPDGLEPVRQELLAALAGDLPIAERARLARALGASAVVAASPLTEWNGEWAGAVWVGSTGAPPALSYLARRVLPAEGLPAAIRSLVAEGFRPDEDAVVEGTGGAVPRAAGSVLAAAGPPHRRSFRVLAEGPGLLVVRQSYLPAWRGRVDGRPQPLLVANGAQIGVPVPAGEHTVELFLPLAPYRAGALGPVVLLVTLLLAAAAARVRRNASDESARSTPANPPAQ